MKTVIIAGMGLLPIEAAKSLTARGDELIIITFTEQGANDFTPYTNQIHTFGLGQVGKILKFLKNSGAEQLVFAGKINKNLLEHNLKLDLKALWILAHLKDRQEDTLMNAIAFEIEKLGIKILKQTDVLEHLIVRAGVFSLKKPRKKEYADVAFAYDKARGVAGLDIGQSLVVKNRTVLAVESIEGTNKTIERGANYCQNGFTFMKVAKPEQDFRFDLPVIGMETIECFAQNGGGVFAFEADYTLVIDLQQCVDFANKNNFILMAYKPK